MRRCLINALFAVAFTFSAPALAQDSNCPPGSWFCEAVPERPAPAPQADPDDEPPPPPESLPQPPVRRQIPQFQTSRPSQPPPVVIYRPASPDAPPPRAQVVIVAPGDAPPRPVARRVVVVKQTNVSPPPTPTIATKAKRTHRRWGLNLRMEGASIGGPEKGGHEGAGMGGVGLSLRYRPVPAFAIDAGIDVLGGTDFNGFARTEVPFSLSAMLYVNPRSRLQFYLLAGGHASHAEIETDTYEPLRDNGDATASVAQYSYVGGHGGVGLEFRLSRLIAFNVDMLGFVRKRSDEGGTPEFTDPLTGKTTNTSGGGLFRGGLTFWW